MLEHQLNAVTGTIVGMKRLVDSHMFFKGTFAPDNGDCSSDGTCGAQHQRQPTCVTA